MHDKRYSTNKTQVNLVQESHAQREQNLHTECYLGNQSLIKCLKTIEWVPIAHGSIGHEPFTALGQWEIPKHGSL